MGCYLKAIFMMMLFSSSKLSHRDTCGRYADFQLLADNSRADVTALMSDFTQLFSICAHQCLTHKLCRSFNYNTETLRCEILSYSYIGSETNRLISSPAWRFYQKARTMVCTNLRLYIIFFFASYVKANNSNHFAFCDSAKKLLPRATSKIA